MKFQSIATSKPIVGRLMLSAAAAALVSFAISAGGAGQASAQWLAATGNPSAGEFQAANHIKKRRRARKRLTRRQRARRRRARRSRKRRTKKVETAGFTTKAKQIAGPVQIVISIPDQRIAVYKGGRHITTSRISSGRRGYATPTGVFSILQKNARHYSNIYRGASMPYMQRITWSGIAMHAGALPGYPASHGCIRLTHSFARSLFSMTEMNQHVIVTRQSFKNVVPQLVNHPRLFQPTSIAAMTGKSRSAGAGDIHSAAQAFEQSTTVAKNAGATGSLVHLSAVEDGDVIIDTAAPVTLNDAAPAGKTKKAPEAEAKPEPRDPRQVMMEFGDFEMQVDRAHRMQRVQASSKKPIRIMVTRRVGRESNAEIQRMLKSAGFDVGDIDGFLGKMSVAAIRAFQEDAGLPVTGRVDETLTDALYKVTGRQKPTNGHLYIRQGYKRIFDVPVTILDADKPLGTHLFVAMAPNGNGKLPWTATTTDNTRVGPRSTNSAETGAGGLTPSTAKEALERIEMPEFARMFIADRLKPGASFVIADNGHSNETGKHTDFIVKTR